MTRRILTIAICLGFLAFGLVRVYAGGGMIGQELGWWNLGGEFPEALADTHRFLAEHRAGAILPFTPLGYLIYIVAMGLVLSAGAIGALLRRRWGLAAIGAYIAMHAALFVNYMVINPKIWLLLATVLLWLALIWLGRRGEARGTA